MSSSRPEYFSILICFSLTSSLPTAFHGTVAGVVEDLRCCVFEDIRRNLSQADHECLRWVHKLIDHNFHRTIWSVDRLPLALRIARHLAGYNAFWQSEHFPFFISGI